MPAVIASRAYRVALGRQSASGTAQTTMDAEIPVYAGPVKPMEDRQSIEVADGNAFLPGEYKSRGWSEGTVEWMTFTDTIGRLFALHLGQGSDSKSGSTNITHVMTRKDTPLYHTIYVYRPNGDGTWSRERHIDSVAKSLELQYASGELVKIRTDILGTKPVGNAAAPAATTITDTASSTAYGLTWVGSTLNFDMSGTPSTTTVHNFKDFVIHMGYDDMQLGWTDDIFARYLDPGRWNLSFSGTVVLENWNYYNQTFFANASPSANTNLSPTVLTGSLDFTLQVGSTADANNTVEIAIPYMSFSVDPPDLDPGGGGLNLNVKGTLVAPTSGQPLTVTVKNQNNVDYGALGA